MGVKKLAAVPLLHEFEQRVGDAVTAYKVLGLSKGHYYDMRRGVQAIPLYLQRSVKFALALPDKQFNAMMSEAIEEWKQAEIKKIEATA